MALVTCPNCKTRVLPKQDGTCPSCQAMLALQQADIHQEPARVSGRIRHSTSEQEVQTKRVLEFLRPLWIMQIISTLLALLKSIASIGFKWPWWPGILGLTSAFLVTIFILYSGFYLRRAFYLFIASACSAIGWVIPLLWTEFSITSSKPILVGAVFFFCGLTGVLYYLSAYNKLLDIWGNNMSDEKRMFWLLIKAFVRNNKRTRNGLLGTFLVFLTPVFGLIIYGSFSIQNTMAVLLFLLACFLLKQTGDQLAIARFIKNAEKRSGKVITV